MKIHNVTQGSQEWLELRKLNFTASELGPFALEPIKVTLTVDEIKDQLDELGIPRKGLTKRDDLLAALPDHTPFLKLCEGAKTAIIKKIVACRPKDAWQLEMDEKIERAFEYSIPVQRGKSLEPKAREYYAKRTGFDVVEVGFIEHDSGGFGCSPDALIEDADGSYRHGLEIKALMPDAHLSYLLDGTLPDEFLYQVHAGMAVTGLDRWDLLLFCPGDASLLIEVQRDEFTDRLEAGLKTLVAEKRKMQAKLAELWDAEFGENADVQPPMRKES